MVLIKVVFSMLEYYIYNVNYVMGLLKMFHSVHFCCHLPKHRICQFYTICYFRGSKWYKLSGSDQGVKDIQYVTDVYHCNDIYTIIKHNKRPSNES